MEEPLISIIILNYNGMKWIPRCLESIREQTIFPQLEIIIPDNASTDGSDKLAANLIRDWPNAFVLPNGANLGYCEGNNRGARKARGKYLFFLNNDTWLEKDCLEKLIPELERLGASGGNPVILNYSDDSLQGFGPAGFDFCGFNTVNRVLERTEEIFVSPGSALVIEADLFQQLGEFDPVLFMYNDETDLSWRVWISGHKLAATPVARMHHRGQPAANPKGGTQVVELRTNERVRYYANRNALLVVLKSGQHILLLLLVPQLLLLLLEACVMLALVRRWSFIRQAYLAAIADCWRLRGHIRAERKRIKGFRRRSDFWMLRFFRLQPGRWHDLKQMLRFGIPKVDVKR